MNRKLFLILMPVLWLIWGNLQEKRVKEAPKKNEWLISTSLLDSLFKQEDFGSAQNIVNKLKSKNLNSSRKMYFLSIYDKKIKSIINSPKQPRSELKKLIKCLETEQEYFVKELEFAYRTLGEILKRIRQHDSSLNFHKKSLQISKNIYGENSIEIARAHNNYAIANFYTGQIDTAETHFKKALNIRKKAGKNHLLDVSKQYNNIGVIYLKKKKYFSALLNLKKALNIRKKILNPMHPLLGSNLLNIGNIYLELGDEVSALVYLNEAISNRSKNRGVSHNSIPKILNSLGIAQKRLGRYVESKSSFSRALQILQTNSINTMQSTFYQMNLGEVYSLEGNYDKAIQIYNAANQKFLNRKRNGTSEHTELYLLIAETYSKSGKVFQALKLFNETFKLNSTIQYRKDSKFSKIQLKLAEHFIRSFEYSNAKIHLNNSLHSILNTNESNSLNDLISVILSSKDIDLLLLKKALISKSNFYHKISELDSFELNKINFTKSEVLIQIIKSNFLLLITKLRIQEFSTFAASRHQLSKNTSINLERILLSLTHLQLLNPQYVFKFINEHYFILTFLKQPELARREVIINFFSQQRAFKNDLSIFLKIINNLNSAIRPDSQEPNPIIEKDGVLNLLTHFEELNIDSATKLDPFGSLHTSLNRSTTNKLNKLSIKTLQQEINDREAIIDFYYLDTGLFSFFLTKSNMELIYIPYETISSSQLQTLRSSILKASLKDNFFDYYSKLGEILLNVYDQQLNGIDYLTIVPNSIISTIPFEALFYSKNSHQKDLSIRNYTISYHYSTFCLFTDRIIRHEMKYKNILLMAPIFLGSFDLKKRYDGIRDVKQFRKYSKNSLKFSQYEIEEIKKLYDLDALESKLLIDKEATEKAFKENAANYHILHLATHSITNQTGITNSAVLFTPPVTPDGNNDGYLYSHEIESMYIPADLVVLSSCDGAVGEDVPGDGVHSLARSFLMAGAKSVLASLWKVPDKYTAKLMIKFHDYWLKGKSKAAALRQAKLDLIADNPDLPPRFWAGFILIGE